MSELDDRPDSIVRRGAPERDRRTSGGCNERVVVRQRNALDIDILAAVNGPFRERDPSGPVETVNAAIR